MNFTPEMKAAAERLANYIYDATCPEPVFADARLILEGIEADYLNTQKAQ